jgi:hypothetical protein
MSSILQDVKKLLHIPAEYDAFDTDITIHINSAFSTLHQLGVGTTNPFSITDSDSEWVDFTQSNTAINSVKTYIWAKVKLAFDPPGTSFHLQALNDICKELEYRLNTESEAKANV